MRRRKKVIPVETALDEYLTGIDFKKLSEVNLSSYSLMTSLRYLLAKSKGQQGNIVYGVKYKNTDLDPDSFKRAFLEDLCEVYSVKNPELEKIFSLANGKMEAIKKALSSAGYAVIDFRAETSSRLIIGISAESFSKLIFDVGLSWDSYLNLPYIPASSLKGAFRAYLRQHNVSLAGLSAETLLGTINEGSYVVFTDSYPVACRTRLLAPEVTTPIYSEVGGKIMESEAQPTPIIYPVVEKGVSFRIIIGIKQAAPEEHSKRKALGELQEKLMTFMFSTLKQGIGAKTLIGYGILV